MTHDQQNQPVTYLGGSLDGTNDLDYAASELREMQERGGGFDHPLWDDDLVEQYRVERTSTGGWVMRLREIVPMPILQRQITVTFVGGSRDGETTRFLGSIRDQRWLATSHFPGYALVHHGDDPLAGWQLEPTELTWQQIWIAVNTPGDYEGDGEADEGASRRPR